MAIKKLSVSAIAVLLALSLVACGTGQAAALAKIVSTSLGTLAVLDPANAGAYTKASGIMLKVSDDIANWKQGQPTDQIVQGLNDAVAILDSVHVVNQQTQALILLAVSTAEAIVAMYPGAAGTSAVQARTKKATVPAPTTAAAYKAKWNSMAPIGAQLK